MLAFMLLQSCFSYISFEFTQQIHLRVQDGSLSENLFLVLVFLVCNKGKMSLW